MRGTQRFSLALISVVALAIYGTTHWLFSLENLLRDVACDDTFYYYKISANLASGVGSTFDGKNLTNGYHPAWGFLLVPLFKLFGTSETALRAALGLQCALVAAAGVMVVVAAHLRQIRTSIALVPYFYWLTRPELLIGMEGALHLFALSALFLAGVLWVDGRRPQVSLLFLLVSAFVITWVRLESLLIAILFVGALLWSQRKIVSRIQMSLIAMAPLAGAATYFGYNYLQFGVYTPISGIIKRYYSSFDLAYGGISKVDNAMAILGLARVVEGLITGVVVLAALVILRRRNRSNEDLPWHAMFVSLALTHIAFAAYALLFLHVALAASSHYYVPLILLTSLAVAYFGEHVLSVLGERLSRRRVNVSALVLTMSICAYLGLSSVHRIWKQSTNTTPDWEMLSYRGISWTDRHLPADAVIGATDAGVMGYFAKHRVVNLDGLVNSAEFYRAVREQDIDAWLAKSAITHFAGVVLPAEDGCRLFATRMRQTNTLRGTCKLIYESNDQLVVSGNPIRAFRVYEFRR